MKGGREGGKGEGRRERGREVGREGGGREETGSESPHVNQRKPGQCLCSGPPDIIICRQIQLQKASQIASTLMAEIRPSVQGQAHGLSAHLAWPSVHAPF